MYMNIYEQNKYVYVFMYISVYSLRTENKKYNLSVAIDFTDSGAKVHCIFSAMFSVN